VAQSEIILTIENVELIEFYGQNDAKLNLVKKAYSDVNIIPRGNQLKLTGDKKRVQECKATLEMMLRMLQEFGELNAQAVQNLLNGENPFESKLKTDSKNIILYGRTGQAIVARTKNQKKIVELSDTNDILFAIGPAGTGKTYTAVALAVKALKNNQVRRIILTRPAVEAGENLGFLPGDLKDKIDPYLRPLYDALDDMIMPEKLTNFMTNRIIEVAPLAFMRGRTLDNAFVILDEAQNATEMQLKMFLTRLGPSAKCIITGDLTQIDLPKNQRSGLFRSLRLLDNIEGIGVVYLETGDVVRHRLVKAIINAYEKDEEMQAIRKHERERDAQENEQKNNDENS
jgi:phosphate starvation-inducible protein PhoH and related proteins